METGICEDLSVLGSTAQFHVYMKPGQHHGALVQWSCDHLAPTVAALAKKLVSVKGNQGHAEGAYNSGYKENKTKQKTNIDT